MARVKLTPEGKQFTREYKAVRGDDAMSSFAFLFAVAVFLLGALVVSVYGAAYIIGNLQAIVTYVGSLGTWGKVGVIAGWLFGWLIAVLILQFLAVISPWWPLTLLLHLAVAALTGMYVAPLCATFPVAVVVNVLFYTALLTFAIIIVAAIWPYSVENWFGAIFAAMLGLLAAYLLMLFALPVLVYFGISPFSVLSVLDWIGIVIFSAAIFYEVNQGLLMARNLNNAVLVAMAVYMNAVNIFIRLLSEYERWQHLLPDVGKVIADSASVVGEGAAVVVEGIASAG